MGQKRMEKIDQAQFYKQGRLEGPAPQLQGLGCLGGLGAKTHLKTGSLEGHHFGSLSKPSHLIMYCGKTLKITQGNFTCSRFPSSPFSLVLLFWVHTMNPTHPSPSDNKNGRGSEVESRMPKLRARLRIIQEHLMTLGFELQEKPLKVGYKS